MQLFVFFAGFALLQSCNAAMNSPDRHLGMSGHLRKHKHHRLLQRGMTRSKRECFTSVGEQHGLTLLGQAMQQQISSVKNPGAGLEPVVPFKRIYKDGFMRTACVKDYMFTHGDKHYDNKYEYTQEKVTNVSIIHYASIVPKGDRKPMTSEVCFNFCRTVKEMTYFGILNGRECYCTPFFKEMASDNSMCDKLCEGSSAEICGGVSKSSIFTMHSCDDTAQYLDSVEKQTDFLEDTLDHWVDWIEGYQTDMQEYATLWQEALGNVGDVGASSLLQTAKIYAADSDTLATKLEDIEDRASSVENDAEDFLDSTQDFENFGNAKQADDYVKQMKSFWPELKVAIKQGEEYKEGLSPTFTGGKPETQYYPVMYFVDKDFETVPTTCTGKTVGNPMVNLNISTCAMACDAAVGACKAFSFFATTDGMNSLCFLFGELESVTYYTKCSGSSFLQKRTLKTSGGSRQVSCLAKLSKYEGTSLKPDASGKCADCLKKVHKADRCFEWPEGVEPDIDSELVDCNGPPNEC